MNIQKLNVPENLADNQLQPRQEICDIPPESRLLEAWASMVRIVRGILSAPALWYLLAGALLLIAVVSLPFSN